MARVGKGRPGGRHHVCKGSRLKGNLRSARRWKSSVGLRVPMGMVLGGYVSWGPGMFLVLS